jgi:hypothetical protein
MIKRPLVIIPLLLVLSLQAMPLAAQSGPAEQTQSAQEPTASPADKNDTASSAATPERSAKEKVTPAKGKASPIDYRTSEPTDINKSQPMPVNM